MFPWLPFFAFAEPILHQTNKKRRRKPLRRVSSQSVKNGEVVTVLVHSIPTAVRIEYVLKRRVSAANLESVKTIFEPKPDDAFQAEREAALKRKRSSFETSPAMLELFGGSPTTQSSKEVEPSVNLQEPEPPLTHSPVKRSPEAKKTDEAREEQIESNIETQPPIQPSSRPENLDAAIDQPTPESPSESDRNANISQTPVAGTPPAVRAAKARQKAFQPSSDMLALFGGGEKAIEREINPPKATSNIVQEESQVKLLFSKWCVLLNFFYTFKIY